MKIQDIELDWLGHSCFKIKFQKKVIFIDPFKINSQEKADIIFLTHSHYDHCSTQDIDKIAKDGTIVVCTADCQSSITRIQKKIEIIPIEPSKELSIGNVKVETIESYNTNKKFHPKSEDWLGYLIFFGKTAVYHAGDTDFIKEMSKLREYSKDYYLISLLPIGGTYTMNVQEAVRAAEVIKPSLAIPMHYGSIIGKDSDAKNFVELCQEKGINAEVLDKQ